MHGRDVRVSRIQRKPVSVAAAVTINVSKNLMNIVHRVLSCSQSSYCSPPNTSLANRPTNFPHPFNFGKSVA